MNLFLLQQYKFIQDLYKNDNYIDILINIDDFFDILNVYSFPNWLDAEIVDVKFFKYFTNIIIKAPKDKMPHPKGAIILTKYDCQVKYKQTKEIVPVEVKSVDDTYINPKTGEREPKVEEKEVWLVDIMILNKHIINDNIYDLQSMQSKLEDKEKEDEKMENVVTNEE